MIELTPLQEELFHMAGIAERSDLKNLANGLRNIAQRVHRTEWENRVLKQKITKKIRRPLRYKRGASHDSPREDKCK